MNIIKSQKIENKIEIYDGYIPDQDVEKFFAACDVVVLPYESATQSGIVQIAYGFEKPVIVTNVGGLPEVVVEGKTGYIVPPRDSSKLAEIVCKYFSDSKKIDFVSEIRKEQFKYSWERIRECIEELY